VLGSLCFPSFPQFCGQLFARTKDKDVALAMLQAYNDWHIESWCGAYPGRFIPLALPAIWDPELMAAEVRRLAAKGCHAVTFSENPTKLGLPSWHSGHWDPFLAACVETSTVICLHIGSSSETVVTAIDAPIDTMITLQPVNIVQAAADLVWSPVLRKFPDLKIALSEGGIGWIPFYLERVDRHFQNQAWIDNSFGEGKLPSDVFREHFLACFITDPSGLKLRDEIGLEVIAWECDYPHTDTTWPESPEYMWNELQSAGCRDDEIHKITWENACRFFDWDPFQHIKKEQASVGALRALAKDVDTARMPRSEWRKRNEAAGIGVF
jgi:predicted TIM-barrel fold metal-dependent hydrolase